MNIAGDIFRSKLDFWIEKNLNVLFIGKHGVGKTATVEAAFQRNNLSYKYFSASTMDPWVDFIGVPKERNTSDLPESFRLIKDLAKIDRIYAQDWVQSNWRLNLEQSQDIVSEILKTKSGISYLDLVKPYDFAIGKVEAIFFDEFNRSPKKVRNAVMELIQFKSINGVKFPHLKIIWAAINPDDEETYDVEKLDPAQLDRFQVHWEMPYKPDSEWFRSKYGERMADSAVQWWNELPEEEKLKVTPRRLQYALDLYQNDGDVRDVLPISSNASKLLSNLTHGPVLFKLEAFVKNKDTSEATKFLANENNYFSSVNFIKTIKTMTNFFLPLLPKEKIAALIHEDEKICKHVLQKSLTTPVFLEICKQVVETNSDVRLVKKIRRFLTENQSFATQFAEDSNKDNLPEIFKPWLQDLDDSNNKFENTVSLIDKLPQNTVAERLNTFHELYNDLPKNVKLEQAKKMLGHLDNMIFRDRIVLDESTKLKIYHSSLHLINFLDEKSTVDFKFPSLNNFLQELEIHGIQ